MTRTAKEIFWAYACNHFFLDRDGALEEYERAGGSREHEPAWRREYIEHWVAKVSTDDLTALRMLKNANAYEAIPSLLSVDEFGDDYAKFWFAFTLHALAGLNGTPKPMVIEALERARILWQQVVGAPVGIAPKHREHVNQNMLEALDATSPEEYLAHYAARKLEEV